METKQQKRRQPLASSKTWKVTVDPTIDTSRLDPVFEEKAARARASLEKYGLPEGWEKR
jgi:hypothetical protein